MTASRLATYLAPEAKSTAGRIVRRTVVFRNWLVMFCALLVLSVGSRPPLAKPWNKSYEKLAGSGLVSFRDCRYGRAGVRAVPPLTHGSHRSKLVDQIRKDPCKGDLTLEEFVKIVTWIDRERWFV